MWIVYNKEDSWTCGWQVNSEKEALEQCLKNDNLTYKYIDESY